jgi:RNA polymerase sigma-70 factor, ECF subfamily
MSITQNQFTILYDQYRERLLNGMIAVVRDRDTAEDITGAALATAWQNRNQFRGESSLYTWCYSIALNEARNRRRRNQGVSLESIDSSNPKELAEPDTLTLALERSECRLQITKALRQIPPVHRRTLVDHFVRGHSVKQIARHNGIPMGTVLSRIFTAKRQLRKAWEA